MTKKELIEELEKDFKDFINNLKSDDAMNNAFAGFSKMLVEADIKKLFNKILNDWLIKTLDEALKPKLEQWIDKFVESPKAELLFEKGLDNALIKYSYRYNKEITNFIEKSFKKNYSKFEGKIDEVVDGDEFMQSILEQIRDAIMRAEIGYPY